MSALRPFSHPGFAGIWAGALTVHLASWLQQVGAASLMTTLTPSPAMAALVQTAASLPAVLLGLPAGALADLLDRRRWLIATQLWTLAVATLAMLVLMAGAMQPWPLLIITALLGTGYALQLPASQAVSGEVVPREQLREALALGGVAFNISRIVGPALAGLLITLGGGMAVYGVVILCTTGVVLYLRQWQGTQARRGRAPPERLWSALRNGLRFVRHSPDTRRQLRSILLCMSVGSAPWALLPVVARDVHHMGPSGYGIMLGALGIGGIAGVGLLPQMRKRWPPHGVVALSMLAFAGVTIVLALKVTLWLLLPVLVLGGALWMCMAASIYAEFQAALPDWVRARAISIYNVVYFLSMGAGAALWGALATPLDVPATLWVSAAGIAAVALWMWRQPIHSDAAVSAKGADHGSLSTWQALPEPRSDVVAEEEAILVQHIYRVQPDLVDDFVHAVGTVGRSYKRSGAEFWRLYRDVRDDNVFAERYMVESWSELQRQQERLTPEDHARRKDLQRFLVPGEEVAVSYHVAQALPLD